MDCGGASYGAACTASPSAASTLRSLSRTPITAPCVGTSHSVAAILDTFPGKRMVPAAGSTSTSSERDMPRVRAHATATKDSSPASLARFGISSEIDQERNDEQRHADHDQPYPVIDEIRVNAQHYTGNRGRKLRLAPAVHHVADAYRADNHADEEIAHGQTCDATPSAACR